MVFGLVSLLIFVLDIYVIYMIIIGGGTLGIKLLWVIIVLLLPFIGPLIYLLLGRGSTA